MATRRFSHQNAPMLCKRTHVLTILSVTLTVVWLRLYIWSAGEVPISESYETHNTNDIEEEWEWARDVSIVYTWVNGSESNFRGQRISHGGGESGGGNADRDNNELLYSLRSLSSFLPWHTGNIYIVTQNQIPIWLNTAHPRIKMVNHSDIIPKEFLPTYNSNVIESYLHQISGLSDIFLYFNDDVFIRSFLHPSDLFTADYGLKLFVENLTIPMSKTQQRIFIAGVKDKPYWRAFFGTIQLLKNSFGEENMKPLRLLQHTPHTFHRGAIERVHKLWKKEFKSVHHHKFRQDGDILFIYAYYGYLVHEGKICCNLEQKNFEVEGMGDRISFLNDTVSNSRTIERFRNRQKRKFFNINDMMGQDAHAGAARGQLSEFLKAEFGTEKSPFEI